MKDIITSRQNPLCQLAKSLRQTKYRRRHQQFLIEGENAVRSAIEARWKLDAILIVPEYEQELQQLLTPNQYDLSVLHRVRNDVLESVCDAQSNPKVAAIATLKSTFEEDLWNRAKVLLVLDGVSDPGNLGTLLRAANASGADGILLTGNCADPFSPKVIRSSAGSIFHCPVEIIDAPTLLKRSAKHNFELISADAHGGIDSNEFDWPQKYFLILGNEKHGISKELLNASKYKITIPIKGRAESLNVAMAGTVLLFGNAQ